MPQYKESRCPDCTCSSPNFVSGRGSCPADVVFVGEGPGDVERELGTPFSGESGNALHQTWLQVTESLGEGVESLEGFETNAWLCFPETVEEEEQVGKTCGRRLRTTLEEMKPKVILAMGGAAIKAVLGKEKVIPHLWKLQASPFLSFPHTVIPTFNPASFLRNPSQYRTFSDTLTLAAKLASNQLAPIPEPKTFIASTCQDVLQFLIELSPCRTLILDLETTRLDPFIELILTLVLSPLSSTSQYSTYIIPWRLITEKVELAQDIWAQVPKEGFEEVKQFLEEVSRSFILHNATFDQNFLRAAGIGPICVAGDPMLLHYAQDERTDRWAGHGLKPLSAQYLGAPDWEENIWSYLKSKNDSFENIPEDVLHEYCRWDTPHTGELNKALLAGADEVELELYETKLLPMREMLADCQAHGVYIDISVLLKERNEAKNDLDRLDQLLQDICGLPMFNPGSTFDVQGVLFKDFGLERPKLEEGSEQEMRGSGEPVLLAMLKQNQEFLREVAKLDDEEEITSLTHLVARLTEVDKRYAFILGILVRRDAAKDITTYFDGVAKYISPFDRCIHPFYHIPGTDTGRFTGSRPSLLNVKNANRVKMPYGARPGYRFGYADQSQFELRVFACRAKDRKLGELLIESDERTARGEKADIHTLVGQMVFPYYNQAPKWWRAIVKTIVYGVLYGRTAYALAKKYGLEVEEAEKYRSAVLDLFPMVKEYEGEIIREIRATQQVETPFGRRKRFPFLPSDRRGWTHIKNAAVNMPIQSIASDINSLSMLDIWKTRTETGVYPLFPIHDAITFEIPKDREAESLVYIKEVMETAPVRHLGSDYGLVPFKVEPEVGDHWGDISEEEGFFAQILALVEKE